MHSNTVLTPVHCIIILLTGMRHAAAVVRSLCWRLPCLPPGLAVETTCRSGPRLWKMPICASCAPFVFLLLHANTFLLSYHYTSTGLVIRRCYGIDDCKGLINIQLMPVRPSHVHAHRRMYRSLFLWICATYRSLNWQSIRASCISCIFLITLTQGKGSWFVRLRIAAG